MKERKKIVWVKPKVNVLLQRNFAWEVIQTQQAMLSDDRQYISAKKSYLEFACVTQIYFMYLSAVLSQQILGNAFLIYIGFISTDFLYYISMMSSGKKFF